LRLKAVKIYVVEKGETLVRLVKEKECVR